MKVLVTGARGMLGQDVCAAFQQAGNEVISMGSVEMNVCDPARTRSTIIAAQPDLVVHCAAYTDVDGCERDPDMAYRVNAVGAGNVASACYAAGARLIAISTDFVFDGGKTEPYTEFDATRPLGIYGASKLAGEEMARAACPDHKIVRTSWLFGAHGKCFPKTILNAARTRPELRVVADQYGTPTSAADLAQALVTLASIPLSGTFHIANSGVCTWRDLAAEALRLAGQDNVKLTPIRAEEWPTPTQRPAYSALRPYLWELLGYALFRPWQEALAEVMEIWSPKP